jgi:hypothetical protein
MPESCTSNFTYFNFPVVLIFKKCVTANFDRHRRFSKSFAIGERYVNISGKRECGEQLTCGLISCGFEMSVFFIFELRECLCSKLKF